MKSSDIEELTTTVPNKTLQEMLVAIGNSMSDVAYSDDVEDAEGEGDEGTEQRKVREDDEPGWVMGTITKTVQQSMERFRQKQMTLGELTQPGWEDAPEYIHETHKKYGTSELTIPAVDQQQMVDDTAAPARTPVGGLMECLEIVLGISQMLQGPSRPGIIHIRLGSVNPQSNLIISSFESAAEPDTSHLLKVKAVEPGSFYPGIKPPAIHHIDVGFERRHGDVSCVSREIDMRSAMFEVISS